MTIERKDVNGNYFPENCVWATWKQQQNNRSNNHRIDFDGINLTLQQWAEKLGIKSSTLRMRFEYGWDTAKVLTTPIRPHKPYP